MKLLTALGLMLISFTSFAADPQMQMMGMDPAKMQQLQNAMTEMKNCMQNLNKDDIKKLKARGQEMEQEIKSLCDAGKRSAALSKALAYRKEVMNAPGMVEMKKCSEKVNNMMPDDMKTEQYSDEKITKENVCDEIK